MGTGGTSDGSPGLFGSGGRSDTLSVDDGATDVAADTAITLKLSAGTTLGLLTSLAGFTTETVGVVRGTGPSQGRTALK